GGTFWVSAVGNNLYVNYSSVPEPGSMILIGIAGLGMAGFRWSKRRGRRDEESEAAESPADQG
ncbi:MAG: PEP-CTERM sorting domain-containing protein, partial [Planctomycetaceae bacterium]|nr:PEP-CTERM sorting domain-containing protein [Planctomycetaceae bacterium]